MHGIQILLPIPQAVHDASLGSEIMGLPFLRALLPPDSPQRTSAEKQTSSSIGFRLSTNR